MAASSGLELVEVGPNQDPPVCRVMDYGRFKYIQGKKDKESLKASRAASKVKEVRLSPVVSENDLKSKMNIAKGLLLEGANVLRKFAEGLSEHSKLERPPTKIGRSINIVLNPIPGIRNKNSNENIETSVSV